MALWRHRDYLSIRLATPSVLGFQHPAPLMSGKFSWIPTISQASSPSPFPHLFSLSLNFTFRYILFTSFHPGILGINGDINGIASSASLSSPHSVEHAAPMVCHEIGFPCVMGDGCVMDRWIVPRPNSSTFPTFVLIFGVNNERTDASNMKSSQLLNMPKQVLGQTSKRPAADMCMTAMTSVRLLLICFACGLWFALSRLWKTRGETTC